jgi:pimeloyl-ACP methyl ester carboxylesterase
VHRTTTVSRATTLGVSLLTALTVAAPGAAAAAPVAAPTRPTPAPSTATVPTPPPVAWGSCGTFSTALVQRGAECGYVTVPLDYAKPKGTTIQLAVSRIRHTSSNNQGVVLTNPGGPGSSGLVLSVLGSYIPNGVGGDYDWIGFDPRGVGASKPALSCDPDYFGYNRPDYVPTNRAVEKYWLDKTGRYAADCGTAEPELLRHVSTIDSAKDMESIRLALAAPQINYYGFSYGTYLGQVYSTLWPTHVRRMVLDSNVDPRKVWYQANLDQDVAFDRNIDIWFGWIARHDAVYHLGTTQQAVRDRWYGERARLAKAPAGGLIGPAEWTDIFLAAGYYQTTWTGLADAFAGWIARRDFATLKKEYDSANSVGDDNGYAVYLAVQCSDVAWPTDFAQWRADNTRVYASAPYETWGNAWYNAPCLAWPAAPGIPVTVDGSRVAPALLIDETLDAATPFEGSLEVRRRFPKAVLLAEPGGTSHAMTPSGNACVDGTIADYLGSGKLPARKAGDTADAECQPLPQPEPAPANAAKQASPSVKVPRQQVPVRPQVSLP